MNERTDKEDTAERDEATITRLLRIAGPRTDVPPDIESRVYRRVRSEWQASTRLPDEGTAYRHVHRAWRRARATRLLLPGALAAMAALTFALAFLQERQGIDQPVTVATVAQIIGIGGGPRLGDAIRVGDRLDTAGGQGLGLQLTRNESLRLDENSSLLVDGADRFTLLEGRVYLDTGQSVYRDVSLTVDTRFGSVTDIGTQFAVALHTDELAVAVREGRVNVRQDAVVQVAVAGERLLLDEGGTVRLEEIAPSDPYWDWAQALAPPFDAGNKTVLDVLKWAARESGRELVFADADLRAAAMRTEVGGSIAGFTPLQAAESVLATTTFQYRIEPRRILVER